MIIYVNLKGKVYVLKEEKSMQLYKNLGGNSGVRAFEVGGDYIDVQFSSGRTYRYSYESAGSVKVEEMKKLAMQGC